MILFSACSPAFHANTKPIQNELDLIACPEAYEVSMDYFISTLESESAIKKMDVDEFKFSLKFEDRNSQDQFYAIYSEFYDDLVRLSIEEKNDNLMELAAQLKLEDSDSELRQRIIQNTKTKIDQLSNNLKTKGMNCNAIKPQVPVTGPQPQKDEPPVNNDPGGGGTPPTPQPTKTVIQKAMEKVLAVSYQSCEVLKLKPLTAEVPLVQGIKEDCCHPDGRGKLRTISSLTDLLQTHYYLQKPLTGPQCFPIRSNPLIYDYGGRPNYTKGVDGKLNFFKNLGGTKVLGYDCSALVYSVLLGGGLRLKPNKPFVASDVVAAQSRQFISPESKGWACLERITLTPKKTIEVGDIIGFDGHVVMIYSKGQDPFGINNISDCADVNLSGFDFNVLQSSPSKDGIGINVYEAKDYLRVGDKMAEIFLDYAKNACESKKQNKSIQLKRTGYSIIRHKNTSECKTNPVAFENESCVVGTCI